MLVTWFETHMDAIASFITKKLDKNSFEYVGVSDEEDDEHSIRVVKPTYDDD